jgi:hypothetical protein
MQNFTSIPFKTESGMSAVNGIAKFSPAGVVLEFESKLFGLINSGIKETRLAISEILDVKFRKGIFKRGAKIEIRPRSLGALQELPSREGKVTLKVQPEDFERAREAVESLKKDLEQFSAALPPKRTPVGSLFDGSEDETEKLPRR